MLGSVNFKMDNSGYRYAYVYDRYGQILVDSLPFSTSDTDVVTVSAWIYWNGVNCTMPFGFSSYCIYVYGNRIGFNTACSDIYGIDAYPLKNNWVHITAEFRKSEHGQIWINGEQQHLKQYYGYFNERNAKITSEFTIFGWRKNQKYTNFGKIRDLRIFNRALSNNEIAILAQGENNV
jgi:hypothetical protein